LPYSRPNQIHSQKDQSSLPPPPTVNSFNWTNKDQHNVPSHNWPNHADISSNYWQESNLPKQDQFAENINNPWPHQVL
jgi:hypothetical protein